MTIPCKSWDQAGICKSFCTLDLIQRALPKICRTRSVQFRIVLSGWEQKVWKPWRPDSDRQTSTFLRKLEFGRPSHKNLKPFYLSNALTKAPMNLCPEWGNRPQNWPPQCPTPSKAADQKHVSMKSLFGLAMILWCKLRLCGIFRCILGHQL